jgi:hypothetical protein
MAYGGPSTAVTYISEWRRISFLVLSNVQEGNKCAETQKGDKETCRKAIATCRNVQKRAEDNNQALCINPAKQINGR